MVAKQDMSSNDTGKLPLFYKNPEVLQPDRHEKLTIDEFTNFAYAAHSNAIPISANEMPIAARSYPLVFVGPPDQLMPVAITALRAQQNLFIDKNGVWLKPHYVPAYVRRYPFIFLRDEARSQYALCIDTASERLGKKGKGKLFENGEISNITKQALDFCTEYQRGLSMTQTAMAALQEFDLFVKRQGDFKLENGETLSVRDFNVIDENKLKKLDDSNVQKLFNSGALSVIYCHMISMHSWPFLVHMQATEAR